MLAKAEPTSTPEEVIRKARIDEIVEKECALVLYESRLALIQRKNAHRGRGSETRCV